MWSVVRGGVYDLLVEFKLLFYGVCNQSFHNIAAEVYKNCDS